MKLKSRGIFMLICCVLLCAMVFIHKKIMTIDDISENDPRNLQNGGHLHVIRKDLDESNYKSDSVKNEKSGNHGDILEEADGNVDSMEEDVIRTIREAIHQNDLLKNREYLQKLVDSIKSQARNRNFGQNEETSFRISWFGRPGNSSELLNLTFRQIDFLKRVKPYKRRFKNATPKKIPIYRHEHNRNLTSSQVFHKQINQYRLYQSQDKVVDTLLHDLATMPIASLKQHEGGTQIKLIFTMSDGSRAMFKPMRFPRERETLPDHYYWSDFERHTAEIAAFHLDRVLGFNRIPPTVGRLINMTTEIRRFADEKLEGTFFHSPAGNLCFFGQCDYYCDSSHAVCGHPDILEGSVMSYLPSTDDLPRKTWRNPWKRSYSKRKKAEWEKNQKYCEKIRRKAPYNRGRRLLDLMDLAIFDFLSGNLDRHHYEIFSAFGNFTMPLHLDNGRAFGRPRFDDLSIIAPVTQCCLIRASTLSKLIHFNDGPLTLSKAMQASLERDPIAPILLEKHLAALDRRVKIILKIVHDCMQKSPVPYKSVIDDGF